MKPYLLIAALLLGGCGATDEARIAALEARVARMDQDLQSLAESSISNSDSISRNADSIVHIANAVEISLGLSKPKKATALCLDCAKPKGPK